MSKENSLCRIHASPVYKYVKNIRSQAKRSRSSFIYIDVNLQNFMLFNKMFSSVGKIIVLQKTDYKDMILQLSMNEILMVLVYKNPFQLKILITKLST